MGTGDHFQVAKWVVVHNIGNKRWVASRLARENWVTILALSLRWPWCIILLLYYITSLVLISSLFSRLRYPTDYLISPIRCLLVHLKLYISETEILIIPIAQAKNLWVILDFWRPNQQQILLVCLEESRIEPLYYLYSY